MKKWYLSQYFTAVAIKKLSLVEANATKSNQHEFNWTNQIKELFGQEKKVIEWKFLYMSDYDDEAVEDQSNLTWYDSRAKSFERTWRSEYRLYFPDNAVMNCASENDTLIIGRLSSWNALVIVAEADSTISNQLQWLFGFTEINPGFSVKSELETDQDKVNFASRAILEAIWIEIEIDNVYENYLDEMLTNFHGSFPTTKIFSEYARSIVGKDAIQWQDADTILMLFMEREEILFRTLEKYLLGERLSTGFIDTNWKPDVEGFVDFSLWVQNRRKSRVWAWFENHIEHIFQIHNVQYATKVITENKAKPDFLFPSIEAYRNPSFPSSKLNILWAKTTCKDRWRQVLSEADRVETKHLITLQTAISEAQTNEMRSRSLQLVIPKKLHETYNKNQQDWLMSLDGFIDLIKTSSRA